MVILRCKLKSTRSGILEKIFKIEGFGGDFQTNDILNFNEIHGWRLRGLISKIIAHKWWSEGKRCDSQFDAPPHIYEHRSSFLLFSGFFDSRSSSHFCPAPTRHEILDFNKI